MYKYQYKNFPFFVLRSHLFPFNYFAEIFSNKTTCIESLKKIFKNSMLQEAIFLASPELFLEMKKWLADQIKNKKEIDKLTYSLTKYLSRICTRCTPFGIFAGLALGEISNDTNIELNSILSYSRHTRYDMNYLCALSQDLMKINFIKTNLKYHSNSSLYKTWQQFRYIESHYINTQRSHLLVGIEYTDFLNEIIKICLNGAYYNDLIDFLISKKISPKDAAIYINDLIDNQIIISELEPVVTGAEYLNIILQICEKLKNSTAKSTQEFEFVFKILQETNIQLTHINKEPPGIDVSRYYSIADSLKKIKTEFNLKYLFQTDLVLSAKSCKIQQKIINSVYQGLCVLNTLTMKQEKTNLKHFCEAFYERYEDKEVPLLKALDPELGIGYKQIDYDLGEFSPLIKDFSFFNAQSNNAETKWDIVQSYLHKQLIDCIRNNSIEFEISDNDLKELFSHEPNWEDLPDTLSVMFQMIENINEQFPEGKIYISSVGGSSAANLLGRFCHAENNIYSLVNLITAKEDELNSDKIIAEIVHLPEARTGNILLRPKLRKYEIPYLAKASTEKEFCIALDDIMLSVKNKKIIMRSQKNNKIIIPRLSNAHNFSNSLPIYNFLCDMQTQGLRTWLNFNWGSISNQFQFLPRVSYKNIVLSLATWHIKINELKKIFEIKDDEHLFNAIKLWRNSYQIPIPSYVLLVDNDNKLFFNLDNIHCIRTLISIIKSRINFILCEFLFNSNNALVKSNTSVFTNQIIVPFFRSQNEGSKFY